MDGYPVFGGTVVLPHGVYEIWAKDAVAVAGARAEIAAARVYKSACVALDGNVRLVPAGGAVGTEAVAPLSWVGTASPAPQLSRRVKVVEVELFRILEALRGDTGVLPGDAELVAAAVDDIDHNGEPKEPEKLMLRFASPLFDEVPPVCAAPVLRPKLSVECR